MVQYYAAFQDDNYYYIVMEYCSGGDLLENLLRDKKAMSERRAAAEVMHPLLTTLSRLHALKIIHRDIKLENIFLDGAGRVRLGDFGLTMSMQQEAAISPVGTVEYMAPEVVALPAVELVSSGQIRASTIPPTNEKVDIWALGVTLYELVTGRLPFEGKDKAEIKAAISGYKLASFPPFVSPQCQAMVRAMLAYDPSERPSADLLLQHPYIQMYCGQRAQVPQVVTVEVRAGPAAGATAPLPTHKQSTTPAAPLIGLPMPMSASSREVSTHNLASHPAAGGHSGGVPRKTSAGSWAAVLRRFSAGHKMHPEQQGQPVHGDGFTDSSNSGGSWGSGGDAQESVGSAAHATGASGKPGVKGAVRRLFTGRKSAPHLTGGEHTTSVFSGQLAPMDAVMHG